MSEEIRNIRLVFLVFASIFSILAYRNFPSPLSYILIAGASALVIFLVLSPLSLRPLFLLWVRIGRAIGAFNTQVLLSLVFLLVICPIGLIMKLLKKDPMNRKLGEKGTYWEPYEISGLNDARRYERQF